MILQAPSFSVMTVWHWVFHDLSAVRYRIYCCLFELAFTCILIAEQKLRG